MNRIPLVDLKANYRRHQAAIDAAMRDVIENTRFIQGKEVKDFEAAYAEFSGVRHAMGVGSGTAALHLALAALGVGPGDEVVAPAHTFIATVEPVSWLGATPRFVDIDPETGALDPAAAEAGARPGQGGAAGAHPRPAGRHGGDHRDRRRGRGPGHRGRRPVAGRGHRQGRRHRGAGRRVRPGRLLLVLPGQEPGRLRRRRRAHHQRRRVRRDGPPAARPRPHHQVRARRGRLRAPAGHAAGGRTAGEAVHSGRRQPAPARAGRAVLGRPGRASATCGCRRRRPARSPSCTTTSCARRTATRCWPT